MRSRKHLSLVLAIAFVLSVVPVTGAGAAPAANAPDAVPDAPASTVISQDTTPVATVLSLSMPYTCNPKQTVTITASLDTTGGVPVAGKTVYIGRVSGSTFSWLATGVTDSNGHFSIRSKPAYRLALQARFNGADGFVKSASVVRIIRPKVLLGKPWTHDKIAFPGQRLPARGTLWPYHATKSGGTTIVCDRLENGRWVQRATFSAKITNTKTGSKYAGVFRLPSAGTWRVRAKHMDYSHATAYGPAQVIKVTDWRKRYVGKRVTGFRNKKKMVAITIDDGPNFRTMQVCSILERYDAKGTFYFTRLLLNRGNRWQAREAYGRGHEIANHTANHKMLTGSFSRSYSQAYLPMASIRAATGFDPVWVRAMGGGINRTGMRAVRKTGQLYSNWSLDSYDSHARYTAPSVLYRNVISQVNSGDVILIHQTHPETIKALPAICRELKRRGYKMVTMSELAANSTAR